jgi:PhnB protein
MAIKNPPSGYHTVTPSLCIDGAAAAIDFYRRAFGAEEVMRMPGPDGRLLHAEIRIGDSMLMLSDVFPDMGSEATRSSVWLYVDDCDALYKQALTAGATSIMEPSDAFWGDRMSQVIDQWGNKWAISTHIKDMTPEEMKAAGDEFMKQAAGQQRPPDSDKA